MKWSNLFTGIVIFSLISTTLLIAEPIKLTDDQMTDVKVQEGIKNLDDSKNTDAENEILQNLSNPIPGTKLENPNNDPNANMSQIELDNLNNQPNQQNLQEQFSQQLFDQYLKPQ